MKFFSILGLALAMVFSMSLAGNDRVAPAINANDKGSFDAVSTLVHKEMTSGGRCSTISARMCRASNGANEDPSPWPYARRPLI